jgi:Zn-dependent metalloprotease
VTVDCAILPPVLLRALAERGTPEQRERARRTLTVDRRRRAARLERPAVPRQTVRGTSARPSGPHRTVSDAHHRTRLPGATVREEGAGPAGDLAADEAYDGLGATYAFFATVLRRDSVDGHGLPLRASVHYDRDYDNAYWDGTQMVFGDGDGQLFGRFTASLDVIGHELSHGVTEVEAGLVYQGQSGALNESMSDVFGVLVKQYALGQTADQADWLIGEELLLPAVKGVALRSMKAPGTAYDDEVLGTDPQPAHMDGYVETDDDNGGVHTNSGIPNHAFYLFATAIGGEAWKKAGKVWYETLRDPGLKPDADFAAFASLSVRVAARHRVARKAKAAWLAVGVPVVRP